MAIQDRGGRRVREVPVAEQAPGRIQEAEVRGLIAHAPHELLEHLPVDLLRVERGVDRRREAAQQRELLDPALEVLELALELLVRVRDLLALDVEKAPGLPPAVVV